MIGWNEFNKELQNRVSDPGLRYMLGLMYERQLETVKQLDQANEVILMMTQTMQNMMGLSDILDGRINELRRTIQGDRDGISVESVPLINERN
jgi:glycine cleavage system H lipoate-binding protein